MWPYCVLISLSSIRYRREGFDFWLVGQDKPKGESGIIVFSSERQYDLEGGPARSLILARGPGQITLLRQLPVSFFEVELIQELGWGAVPRGMCVLHHDQVCRHQSEA